MKKILYILTALVGMSVSAQIPTPGTKQEKSTVITNVTIHVGNGTSIENGAVAFKEGKITEVVDLSKAKVDLTQYEKAIDGKGQHVYPGFIVANSTIGITEIEAVRASNDFAEVGKYKPNVRSIIAYNTDSRVTPTVRTNGVLMGQCVPRGGRVTGTSSVVQYDAWNWEDAIVREDDGIHVSWPRQYARTGWWAEPGETSKSKNYDSELDELTAFFRKAKAYNEGEAKQINLVLKSMKGLFNGSQTLYIHCNMSKEITEAVHFAKDMNIKNLVIVGGKDALMVSDLLKENKVSVILSRVHDLPSTQDSDVDQMYAMPAKLDAAGITYCIDYSGDMEAMGARNLPFTAGTAVAYGLDYEKAVQLLTLNPAKILGIDANYGSIEIGKSATLFISAGDALDMRTNDVQKAYIDGRELDLNNHQKELSRKYSDKFGIDVKE